MFYHVFVDSGLELNLFFRMSFKILDNIWGETFGGVGVQFEEHEYTLDILVNINSSHNYYLLESFPHAQGIPAFYPSH
jgi:hypothetical protein